MQLFATNNQHGASGTCNVIEVIQLVLVTAQTSCSPTKTGCHQASAQLAASWYSLLIGLRAMPPGTPRSHSLDRHWS